MMNGSAHQYEDKLLDFAYGELSASEAAAVEAHVRTCVKCSQALANITGVRSVFAALPVEAAPSAGLESLLGYAEQHARRIRAPKERSRNRWILAFASVAGLFVIGVIGFRATQQAPQSTDAVLAAAQREERALTAAVPKALPPPSAQGEVAKNEAGKNEARKNEARKNEEDATDNKAGASGFADERSAALDKVFEAAKSVGGPLSTPTRRSVGQAPQPVSEQAASEQAGSESKSETRGRANEPPPILAEREMNAASADLPASAPKLDGPVVRGSKDTSTLSAPESKRVARKEATNEVGAPGKAASKTTELGGFGGSRLDSSNLGSDIVRDSARASGGGRFDDRMEGTRARQSATGGTASPPRGSSTVSPSYGVSASSSAPSPEPSSPPPSPPLEQPKVAAQSAYGLPSSLPRQRTSVSDDEAGPSGDSFGQVQTAEPRAESAERRVQKQQAVDGLLQKARQAGAADDRRTEVEAAVAALSAGASGYSRVEALKRACDGFEALGEVDRAQPFCELLLREFPATAAAKQVVDRRRVDTRQKASVKSKKPASAVDEAPAQSAH